MENRIHHQLTINDLLSLYGLFLELFHVLLIDTQSPGLHLKALHIRLQVCPQGSVMGIYKQRPLNTRTDTHTQFFSW